MPDIELRRTLRLDFGEMAKVIAKPFDGPAIEPRPKGWLGDGRAASVRHPLIIVGDAGDHVDVGVDVSWHGCNSL